MAEKRSGSLLFPFEEDNETAGLKRADTVGLIIKSSIACFLLTSPGQRRGNPIGSFLPSLRHKLIPTNLVQGLEEALKKELTIQFPGVQFLEVQMTQDTEDKVANLKVRVVFGTPVSELEELTVNLS